MDQAEQLSELISEIYDAALDPSQWSDVVGKAGRFVGGSSAAIFSKNRTAGNGNAYNEFPVLARTIAMRMQNSSLPRPATASMTSGT